MNKLTQWQALCCRFALHQPRRRVSTRGHNKEIVDAPTQRLLDKRWPTKVQKIVDTSDSEIETLTSNDFIRQESRLSMALIHEQCNRRPTS